MTAQRTLADDVPQNPKHGQRWFKEGLCVGCGEKKEHREPYHCDACYTRILPAIQDYDDD